ncbi:unnamed protein product, partial [Owenia fusiformis]
MPKSGPREIRDINDHLIEDHFVAKNAPFGTTDTPTNVRVKIIGGKKVLVPETFPEKQRRQQLKDAAELSPLSGSPGSPQGTSQKKRYDPNPFDDPQKRSYSIQESQAGGESPMPKNINPYSPLPPIPSPDTHNTQPRQTSNNINENDHTKDELYDRNLLGADQLPSKSIALSKQDELELLQRIKKDLESFDPRKLKDMYIDFSGFDKDLSGYITYKDLCFTLIKSQAYVQPESLRLMCAQFISDMNPNMVNYEKILAFMSAAMKRSTEETSHVDPKRGDSKIVLPPYGFDPERKVERDITENAQPNYRRGSSQQSGNYYSNPITQADGASPPHLGAFKVQREDVKLLKMIEQCLMNSDDEIRLDRVRLTFQLTDKYHRGTLSEMQIKEICRFHRLPLQESIINKILDHVDDRGQGQYESIDILFNRQQKQYDWEQFLKFLERVQPQETGLRIPPSKRPTEYVKHYPAPSANWPLGDSSPRDRQPKAQETQPDKYTTTKQMEYAPPAEIDPNAYLSPRIARPDALDYI